MKTNSYRNPMAYNVESNAYELEVPQDFQVTADGILYEVKVQKIIKEKNHLFNCITSAEDYPYALEQYLKKQMHIFSSEAKVLLIYFDQELSLYATLPIQLSINKTCKDVTGADMSCTANNKVMSFLDWQHLITSS